MFTRPAQLTGLNAESRSTGTLETMATRCRRPAPPRGWRAAVAGVLLAAGPRSLRGRRDYGPERPHGHHSGGRGVTSVRL
jgi:hypothetical protein